MPKVRPFACMFGNMQLGERRLLSLHVTRSSVLLEKRCSYLLQFQLVIRMSEND